MSFLAKPGSFTNKAKVAFNPQSLFRGGEQGFWYDPSDFSTMFQDSAGTTPVTAVEQPVGLVLDKSQGLAVGSELVTNGGFDSDTSWTKNAAATISGGTANFDGTTSLAASVSLLTSASSVPVIAGLLYKVTYTIVTSTTNLISVGFGGAAPGSTHSAPGTYTEYLFAPASNASVIVQTRGATGVRSGAIDNISIKLISGNHAYQSTSASRPVLSARVNLLTYSEQFDNAAWLKTGGTATANATTAPDGSSTADLFTVDTSTGQHTIETASLMTAGVSYNVRLYVKANGVRYFTVTNQGSAPYGACFDLQTGALAIAAGANVTATGITAVGSGWYLITATLTAGFGKVSFALNSAASNGFSSYTGNGTDGVYLAMADLRPANVGVGLPSYQRIAASTDYDTAGFPYYLKSDGVDDFLVTNTITPGTDKAQVFAGVRKLSDAASGIVLEYSANWNTNAGAFYFDNHDTSGREWASGARGTTVAAATQVAYDTMAAPDTAVMTITHDIAGDLSTLRRNGVDKTSGAGDKGTGDFGSYPLYIGRRGGSSTPFNGRIYGLVVRFGANLSAAQIAQMNSYMNARTKAY